MRKRNRGGALLLVLLLTLGGAWPAYAAEPETPPPAATEESGLPAPEPEEPPQPAPMISAVVTGFAGDGLPALPAVTLPVRQTGNSDDDLEPLYRLAVQHQSVTALVTAGEESRQEPLGVAWDFGDIDQTKTGTYQAVGRIELPEGYVLARGCAGGTVHPGPRWRISPRRSSPQWNPGTPIPTHLPCPWAVLWRFWRRNFASPPIPSNAKRRVGKP